MRNYEVMFVIDPALEDAKKDATVESVQSIIAADGEVGKVDVWGMRKLAYPIDKKEEGYYAVVEFQGNPTLPKELDRRLKISDNVIRHIIINKDEQSARWMYEQCCFDRKIDKRSRTSLYFRFADGGGYLYDSYRQACQSRRRKAD